MLSREMSLVRELSSAEAESKEASFEQVYTDHADDVARWITHLVGPTADVEDLAHDVFAIALRRWSSFRGDARPRTWLYRIALNVARNHRRWRRLRRLLPLDDLTTAGHAHPAPDADVTLSSRQDAERVHRLLDLLSEKDRTVLVMFELEELSGAEIAELLSIRINTVWVRLHRARQAFTRVVAESGGGASE